MKIRRLIELSTAFVVTLSSLLALSVPLAHAATFNCVWTGTAGDGKLNTPTNWSNCGGGAPVPSDNDNLIFDKNAVTAGVLDNDIPGASFSSIIIDGAGSAGFTFTGNSMTFVDGSGSITDNSSTAGSFDTFNVPIVMSANHTASVSNKDVVLTLGSAANAMTGTGNIAKAGPGTLAMAGNNTGWTGSITAAAGTVVASNGNAFGASPTDAIFNNGADFTIKSCSDMTFNGNVTLNGASSITTGDYPNSKIKSTVGCSGSSGTSVENYGFSSQDNTTVTFAGSINLGNDVTFAGTTGTTRITGNLLGAHSITMLPGYTGKLIINSGNNVSTTPNGTYTSALFSKTISDSNSNSVEIFKNNNITIDGTRGATIIHNGGLLLGTGTVGALSVESGGNVAPGHSPGCLKSGNLTLNGVYQAQIGGTTACSGYDQINVTGSVTLTGSTLSTTLYNGFVPQSGQSFTIITNDGSDSVTGSFSGISEGGTVTADGVTYIVSYKGGDGNDVTLTVKTVDPTKLPGAPKTGFQLITGNPLATFAVTLLASLALVVLARRLKTAK